MRHFSDEDTDFSESEFEDYIDEVYRQLKKKRYEVKVSRSLFKCPFCPGKRRQEYPYHELLQHAKGFGKSSRHGNSKEKGKHIALADYLPKYHGPRVSSNPPEQKSVHLSYDRNEKYVWPWKGIIANLPVQKQNGRYVGESGSKLRDELIRKGFNPLKVIPLWSREGHSGFAIVNFNKDFGGFANAMSFEKSYDADSHGRRHWYSPRSHGDNLLYGWVAKEADYNSNGLIGKHLRDNGDLKSIDEVEHEENRKTKSLVSNLTKTIESKDIQCKEIQSKLHETCASLDKVMEEKDAMTQKYNTEMLRMQRETHEDTKKIFYEHEYFKMKLESRKEQLEKREKDLKKREANYDNEIIKLRRLRKMNDLASQEQEKVDQNVQRLIEEQKREKENLHKRILDLQSEIDQRQALELQIEQLRGAAQVMEHMGRDAETKKKMEDINEELQDKEDELEAMESLTQTLIIKERKCNDELQEARKELINGLKDSKQGRATIVVKTMGSLDGKVFQKVAKSKYPPKEATTKAEELMSLCRSYIEDPHWHPFKTISEHGVHKEVINEEDEKLQNLRIELGDELWQALIIALGEINEYNPSGRYPVLELWNVKEERKATIKEGAEYILNRWRTLKKQKRY